MAAGLKIALVWRGTRDERETATAHGNRLRYVFDALAELGVDARPAVYSDDAVEDVRAQLLGMDGVLVWVNPIADGQDRARLDPLLREVAAQGVWVSAHPDVILKMGTKETLYRTRDLGWDSDCHLYRSHEELLRQLPARLVSGAARVLKQNRGNGGEGVWKVSFAQRSAEASVSNLDSTVEVLHALRGSVVERMSLRAFLDRCGTYFAAEGKMIDQAFQERLPEGMIRCYMVGDRVIGYGHQLVKALVQPPAEGPSSPAAQPGPRIMSDATNPAFQVLRQRMESEWIPAMQRLLDIDSASLPVIWDADFLLGAKTASGKDTHVLCEINSSCVFPFPDEAISALAQAAVERTRAAKQARSS